MLIELAMVLAVIGLIIGAVAIGKDVQRNAEYNKISNKFVDQWKMTYDQYYQRTGTVVGDCQQAPTYMINGAESALVATVLASVRGAKRSQAFQRILKTQE